MGMKGDGRGLKTSVHTSPPSIPSFLFLFVYLPLVLSLKFHRKLKIYYLTTAVALIRSFISLITNNNETVETDNWKSDYFCETRPVSFFADANFNNINEEFRIPLRNTKPGVKQSICREKRTEREKISLTLCSPITLR